MKKMTLLLAIYVVAAIFASCKKVDPPCTIACKNGGTVTSNCGCNCPSGFTGTQCEIAPAPACQTNHLTYIYFQNRSKTNKTYSIVFDGVIMTNVSPGKTSSMYTAAAGNHTLEFKIAGSTTTACTKTTLNLAQCAVNTYYCDN